MPAPIFSLATTGTDPKATTSQILEDEVNRVVGITFDQANPEDRDAAAASALSASNDADSAFDSKTAAQTAASDALTAAQAAGADIYADTAAGLAGTVSGDVFLVPFSGAFIIYENDGGAAVEVGRTRPNAMTGAVSVATGGSRVSITNNASKIAAPRALLHIENSGGNTNSLLTQAFWQGTTAAPYTNNDVQLIETHNDIVSDSTNYSWALSSSNAYNNIPLGVTDGGFRVGVLGWATSVLKAGYSHDGTLEAQVGTWGRAGWQGPGSPATGVINAAVGARGEIACESPGHIGTGIAGDFKVSKVDGTIGTAYAIFANASGGTSGNYSFYGAAGDFYNVDTAFFGAEYQDIDAPLATRVPGNSVEFGFPAPGYGATLGATPSAGYPFVAFCAKTDATGNTFTTSGKRGAVIYSSLSGDLIFSTIPIASASGQSAVEKMRVRSDGKIEIQDGLIIKANTAPTSATDTGVQGEVRYDDNYIYRCIATDTWKRSPLTTW